MARRRKMINKNVIIRQIKKGKLLFSLLAMSLILISCKGKEEIFNTAFQDLEIPIQKITDFIKEMPASEISTVPESTISVDWSNWDNIIPQYTGQAFDSINNNQPLFNEEEKINETAFEYYSELDALGRCQTAFANICPELMPSEDRKAIGMIKPAGWHTVKYPGLVDGNYLYNRCHLIAFALAGENANAKNLITGTRYFNVKGMLPLEEQVADYVNRTGNHVLYRVTPVYEGDNLLCKGVRIEAYSVEDQGAGICFHVFAHNVQPGIIIDYRTGESWLEKADY